MNNLDVAASYDALCRSQGASAFLADAQALLTVARALARASTRVLKEGGSPPSALSDLAVRARVLLEHADLDLSEIECDL